MRTVLVALALFAASLLQAQERTLAWKALDVSAKLDNDGTLRVSERHRMLFDGNWNGGERIFRVEHGQQLALLGMSRVDENGETHAMAEASGDGVGLHEYRFDGRTLRWRARQGFDPPFRNAERTYVIDYTLRNVVERNGETWVLDHDFAFVDRPGPIESFSANLDLDSAWQGPPDFMSRFERTDVPPGESVVLRVELKWTGEGQPDYVAPLVPPGRTPAPGVVETPRPVFPASPPRPRASTAVKLAALGAFVLAAVLLMSRFLRREEALGRYEPPPDVTPEWLEQNLLVHRAEVVGAAWDGVTGPGEVAALIAIMTAEGKIENVSGAPKLRLLVPRESLSDYERGFVDALFINGNEIDPETLRRHYHEVGFRPEKTIAAPLNAAARKLVGSAPASSWALGCVALAVTAFIFPIVAVAFLLTLALVAAYRGTLPGRRMATALPFPLLFAALLHTYVNVSLGWLIGSLVAGALLLWLALRFASWRESEHELRNLRNFYAARDFLRQRIVLRDPEVDPRWIPYMLAFGLVPEDRWAVAAATRPVQSDWLETRSSSPVAGSGGGRVGGGSAAPAFQAGGGSFGGAGATGSWASIQAFASAVAATPPRSASSSGSTSSGSGWSWSSSGGSSSSSGSSWSSSGSSSSSGSRSSSSSGGGSRSGGGGGGGW
ncbi:MAG: DUF2207 domain-containing protein [Thermoanaerobaculia bacterium]